MTRHVTWKYAPFQPHNELVMSDWPALPHAASFSIFRLGRNSFSFLSFFTLHRAWTAGRLGSGAVINFTALATTIGHVDMYLDAQWHFRIFFLALTSLTRSSAYKLCARELYWDPEWCLHESITPPPPTSRQLLYSCKRKVNFFRFRNEVDIMGLDADLLSR